MTQDPYGRPPGSGYAGRAEVVPDDETPPPTAPVTRFQKVASAFRGDRADPAVTDRTSSEPGAEPTGPQSPDPNGTWPGTSPVGQDAQEVRDEADRARPEEVVAVRSPDEGTRDYWDDTDETSSEEATAAASPDEPAASADPTMTQPDLYGTAVRAEADAATAGPAGIPAREGPGEPDNALGDFNDLTFGRLLPDTSEFRARWQQVQFRFVDDPQGSVTEAADVIAQVTAKLEAAIAERQRAVSARQRALRDRWSDGKSADTESLRETLLMYRAFLDQLTGPGAG